MSTNGRLRVSVNEWQVEGECYEWQVEGEC